jgi:branched-chain amino acid aminotransferase
MPFHQYFNGEVFPIDVPLFKTNDLGLLRGYGLFDYFRTYNGVPFRFDDYWRRFENSARLLKLRLSLDQAETEALLAGLYARSGEKEVAFRFILTGGYAPDSVHVSEPNFLIRTEPLPQDNPAGRTAGIKVLPYDYVRDLPEIKSTNYVHMVRMADLMAEQRAADLLYHKDGEVSELTRSNIFILKGNKLITSNRNILEGITRRVVIELAVPHFEVHERKVTLEELLDADEVFTTSTTKWVMPVVAVGDRPIGNGGAGEGTLFLQQKFEALVSAWGR